VIWVAAVVTIVAVAIATSARLQLQRERNRRIEDGLVKSVTMGNAHHLARALEVFAERGQDLTRRMCHHGLCTASECSRCRNVMQARIALELHAPFDQGSPDTERTA